MKQPFSPLVYLLPRLQDVVFLAILLGAARYGARLFNLDGDTGRHIAIGDYMLQQGSIPTHDIFSHTMQGALLVPHEWLAQIGFALVHRLMGLDGVVLLTSLILAATFTLIYREILERRSYRLVALTVTLWVTAISSIHWLARPHIFTMLFLALWSFWLERAITKRDLPLWQFPALMWLWANTHGAFIAGFVVWGAYLAEWMWDGWQTRQPNRQTGQILLLIGFSALAVTFANPSGWLLWQTSLGYIGNQYLVDHTAEYLSPNFHLSPLRPFLLLLALFLFALSRGIRLELRQSILLAGWAAMSLYSVRNVPLFAIVTAPLLAQILQTAATKLPRLQRQERNLAHIENQLHGFFFPILGIILLAGAFSSGIRLDTAGKGNIYNPEIFPVQAVTWLEENPQAGKVFNYFPWGGYLLYRHGVQAQVFIDGQTDFYGEALTREYETVLLAKDGWQDVMEKYGVGWAILPADLSLAGTLAQNGWREAYRDETAVILVRE